MTIDQYKKLSEHNQLRKLIRDGVCIGNMDTTLLFQIDGFYIEAKEDGRFMAFDDMERLEPYLEAMSL